MVQQQSSSASSSVRTLPPVTTKPSRPPENGKAKPVARKSLLPSSTPFWFGLGVSITWTIAILFVVAKSGPGHTFGGVPLVNWALGISAIVSPVALVWMVTAYLQRATDIQAIAEPLRRQLMLVTGESGAAEVRIRRFNQAIREQIELLRSTQSGTQGDLNAAMDRVRQHRNELERFEHASIHQVKEIQEVLRRNMQHIEQLMDDKFTMMRVLDDRLVQNGDSVARQTEIVRDQIDKMLKEVERCSLQVVSSVDQAMQDSKKLADISMTQKSTLTAAAESAAETLGSVSSKIDFSVAHFLERAGSAREEAERLVNALDTQTRSLDEFSNILPSRVGEAETILRGVADRLYASEQLAREQAVHLTDKLSQQVDGLQSFMDRFSTRMNEIDGRLEKRSGDLEGIAQRVNGSTESFVSSWEKSVMDLSERTNKSLMRFTAVNEDTRRNADVVNQQLTATTHHYEDVAVRMHTLTNESHVALKSMTEDIVTHLTQFESLRKASHLAGEEVQTRATSAMQNLQFVLERLLAAREATQSVGATLVKDLHGAVEQNEQMITRLNEVAQMSVHALGIATESLGKQQGELVGQTRRAETALQEVAVQWQLQTQNAEKGLREQTVGLVGLLTDVQNQLVTTDEKLKGFATQAVAPIHQALQYIDNSTAQGLGAMSEYGDGLKEQLNRLQQFNGHIRDMGSELTRVTHETLDGIDQMNARFVSAKAAQEETARQTLEQFSSLSDRLQHEIASLDGQTTKAVTILQQATAGVGEKSYQLLQSAQNSGAQMHTIASALQNEALQIRAILQKQSDDLSADLSRAEKQFISLGDALKQRTDSAYALLDRVASHYNEVTRAASQDLETRTQHIEQSTGQAQSKVENLTAVLTQQLSLIGTGTTQLEAHASQIGSVSSRTLQNLSALHEKIAITHEAANSNAQQIMSRLDECNTAFMRQTNSLSDATQNSVTLIQRAGASFNEQSGKLLDVSQQIDQNVRQLTATTSALADQSTQIRSNMEQQSQRLIASLTESITQLDSSNNKLQQSVSSATLGADQASARFNELTQSATNRLVTGQRDMQQIAERAENTLTALGSNISQQSVSLTALNEQLVEQHRITNQTNEAQRVQLVELFDKLGAAHSEASSLGERTIARLTEALNQIQRHLGALSDQSQTTVSNIRMATTGFVDHAGVLIQNAQAAEQQARTVLSVTSALQDQSRQLRESLHTESERTHDILTSLLGKISSGSAEMRDMGTNTEIVLTSLQNGLAQQATSLNGTVQQISDRQRSLTIALDAQRDVINGLLNRLALAQDETASHAERASVRLIEGTQKLEHNVETLDARAQSALFAVQNATAGFIQEVAVLENHAQQAETQARTMTSAAIALQEQERQLRDSLHKESEKSSDMLGGLLGKITQGHIQLRETSESAESTLSTLNNLFSSEANNVNSAIQQIWERQRDLTGTLSEQRDILNSLLSRINTTHDATASAAEKIINHLTDGSQQITQQIDTLSLHAEHALANVKAAGSGFAIEANALNTQVEQAEQQMRGVLSVVVGMQDQAHQLRQAMQGDTSHVVEQMTKIIQQLDVVEKQMKQSSGGVIQTLDRATSQFMNLTNNSESILSRQVTSLIDAANQTEARLDQAGDKIRHHVKLVTDAGHEAEQKAHQIADTAEYAITKMGTLRTTLTESDNSGRTLIAEAAQRIENVKSLMQDELHNLVGLSKQFMAESNDLRNNLALTESQLAEAAAAVNNESKQVVSSIALSTSSFQKATHLLKDQAQSADHVLVGTADRFISVTTTARESMAEEMRRISLLADNAGQILSQFNQTLSDQVLSMQQHTTNLSGEQKELVESAAQSIAHLVQASDRLVQLRSDASINAEKLAQNYDALDQRAVATNQRLTTTNDLVIRNMDSLTQATQRAESQMLGASNDFREQLERIRSGVQAQIDDINRGLMQITAQLERTSTTLRTTTSSTLSDVERISQRFDNTSKEASSQLEEKTTRMRSATEEVAKLLLGFGDQLDTLLSRLSMAGDGIRRHEGDLVNNLQTALTHLSTVAERLEDGRILTSSVTEQAIGRLNAVGEALQEQTQLLTTGSQTAAGIMRGVGQIYGDQTEKMNRGIVESYSQVQSMNKTIDDMQARTDRMRVSLKLQGEELMSSLQQILTQLSMTGDSLSDTVDSVLQQQAAKNLQKIS